MLPITMTSQDVVNVTGITGQAPPDDNVARFDVPAGWTDLCYRPVLSGKETTLATRVPLQ